MNSSDLHAFYKTKENSFSASLDRLNKKINVISNLRLAVVLVVLILTYFAFTKSIVAFYPIPILLISFIWFIFKHAELFKQKVHLENLVMVNQLESKGIYGDFSGFDAGASFIEPSHAYTHDLDIFGDGSFFQAVNRCNTIQGRKDFAYHLSYPLQSKEDIISQQAAIKELTTKTDFRQDVAAAGYETQEQEADHAELLLWLSRDSFVYKYKAFRYLLVLLPIVTAIAVVGAFFSPWVKAFAIFLATIQWIILGLRIKRVNAFHERIGRTKIILEKYANVLFYLQQEKFETSVLKDLHANAQQADQKLKELATLVGAFNARSNALMNFLVNSVLMYDLQYVYRLERWKDQNENNLRKWLDAVSKIEGLCSWATFSFNHPTFVYPEISDDLTLKATNLGHPLISPAECITNDVSLGQDSSILIVTGANMAGKSTFLRTIGLNVVIALNGAPVFASTFKCPLVLLRTGMRTADSLKDHQSYFYAELNRLKSIVDQLRNNVPLLILLDEILKGTNSTDKQAGSIALVKQLIPHPCLALIATHDLALGDLEQEFPKNVKNFHFEPNIENDQLSFDYKLKRGIAEKMNATFLMKKMGIIPNS